MSEIERRPSVGPYAPSAAVPAGPFGRGLRRERAAAYVGVSAGVFDDMVRKGDLPRPRLLGGGRVKVWDRADLDAAIEAAPIDGETVRTGWDDL